MNKSKKKRSVCITLIDLQYDSKYRMKINENKYFTTRKNNNFGQYTKHVIKVQAKTKCKNKKGRK